MATDPFFREAAVQFQNRHFTATKVTGASSPIHEPAEPAISVLAEVATHTASLPVPPATPCAIRVQPQRTHRSTVGPDFVTPSLRQPRYASAVPHLVPQSVAMPCPLETGPPLSQVTTRSSSTRAFGPERGAIALRQVLERGQAETPRLHQGRAPRGGNQHGRTRF